MQNLVVFFYDSIEISHRLMLTSYIEVITETKATFHVFLWGGTKSLGTAATSGLFYKPQMIDEGDCGAIGGIKIGRGNRSTRRKPAPTPLCPPQIPHDQNRARTRAAAVGSQRLTLELILQITCTGERGFKFQITFVSETEIQSIKVTLASTFVKKNEFNNSIKFNSCEILKIV
jgi:hypothetical protein